MRSKGRLGFLLLCMAAAVAAQEVRELKSAKIWVQGKAEFEELLRTAEIVSIEDIGMGVTDPKKAYLKEGERTLKAVWKPLPRGRQKGFWESYQAEVAAYELDKLLGLNMVPPTVMREIKGQKGSLQLWVDDCKLYKEVQSETPDTVDWSHQLSRMKMFDNLICNRDRNAGNFMVDVAWSIVLIDHSRAFLSDKKLHSPPVQFDRRLVERLRGLKQEELDLALKGLMGKGDVKNILARRDALIAHLEGLIAQKGEAAVFF